MQHVRQPAVYILANAPRGTLYVGMTGWLRHRIHEHREGLVDGFTKRHGLKTLVWFEWHVDFRSAIRRETQLKKWNRVWKLELIETTNPQGQDRWGDIAE
ncbi:MAG TPA: GIY-YIG nuclease family protein [Dokdonella sp.]|nr:GIY-YIG nuclease family protein [Dokdonella sp.]